MIFKLPFFENSLFYSKSKNSLNFIEQIQVSNPTNSGDIVYHFDLTKNPKKSVCKNKAKCNKLIEKLTSTNTKKDVRNFIKQKKNVSVEYNKDFTLSWKLSEWKKLLNDYNCFCVILDIKQETYKNNMYTQIKTILGKDLDDTVEKLYNKFYENLFQQNNNRKYIYQTITDQKNKNQMPTKIPLKLEQTKPFNTIYDESQYQSSLIAAAEKAAAEKAAAEKAAAENAAARTIQKATKTHQSKKHLSALQHLVNKIQHFSNNNTIKSVQTNLNNLNREINILIRRLPGNSKTRNVNSQHYTEIKEKAQSNTQYKLDILNGTEKLKNLQTNIEQKTQKSIRLQSSPLTNHSNHSKIQNEIIKLTKEKNDVEQQIIEKIKTKIEKTINDSATIIKRETTPLSGELTPTISESGVTTPFESGVTTPVDSGVITPVDSGVITNIIYTPFESGGFTPTNTTPSGKLTPEYPLSRGVSPLRTLYNASQKNFHELYYKEKSPSRRETLPSSTTSSVISNHPIIHKIRAASESFIRQSESRGQPRAQSTTANVSKERTNIKESLATFSKFQNEIETIVTPNQSNFNHFSPYSENQIKTIQENKDELDNILGELQEFNTNQQKQKELEWYKKAAQAPIKIDNWTTSIVQPIMEQHPAMREGFGKVAYKTMRNPRGFPYNNFGYSAK